MWSNGRIGDFEFWVKHYEGGSEFGIDGGQVSKLLIRRVGETNDLLAYDRGWDIRSEDAEVLEVYTAVLKRYN